MIRNKFFQQVEEAELRGATKDELKQILGSRRSKLGIFEGDLDEGELEIGQVSASISEIKPAAEILREIWAGYTTLKSKLCHGITED